MKNAKRLTAALGLLVLYSASAASAAEPQAAPGTRVEKDLLGEKAIPADAYYGVQTARALENFQISGVTMNHYPGFVEAWAIVKLAAARANTDVGAMKKEKLAMIEKACQAVLDGKYHDQFQVDWYQGGAGTSTNMNANEVLANVALELTGHKKGEYQFLEPHDDLNMSQSTNDSYPTAIKVALILRNDKLIAELEQLAASFRAKGDAVPEDREDGPHRAAGRGADDGRPGVPRLRGRARGRDPAAARRGEVPLRGQHGRDRDRHRHQRPQGLRGEVRRSTWPSSPASRSCRPRTCSPPPGTSRASSSTPARSRASRSSCRRSPAT